MAKRARRKKARRRRGRTRPLRWLGRWAARVALGVVVLLAVIVLAHRVLAPPKTYFMRQEERRLGAIERGWVALDDVAPVMARAVAAAEDANFCTHWGFDVTAIRSAIAEGAGRGASTITQQVVKNVYLWHGRSWLRKALEALITPVVEAFWPKRRIIEVYLNVAEFDEGVFGIGPAAQHYFDIAPAALSPARAARLAAVLPAPKVRSAANPDAALRRRATAIMDGAATIHRDGRSACFED